MVFVVMAFAIGTIVLTAEIEDAVATYNYVVASDVAVVLLLLLV